MDLSEGSEFMNQVLRELLMADPCHTSVWWRYSIGQKSLALLLVTATCLHDVQSAIFTDILLM